MTTERVKEILCWYGSDNPGTLANLARMLTAGTLGGTGKAGHPARRPGLRARPGPQLRPQSRGLRPALSLRAGDRGRLQRLRRAARLHRGRRPRVRRPDPADPQAQQPRRPRWTSAIRARRITGSVDDALRLGCVAIGFTIYPGSAHRLEHVRADPRRSPRRPRPMGSPSSSGRTRAAPASARRARPRSTSPPTRRTSPPSSARTSSR